MSSTTTPRKRRFARSLHPFLAGAARTFDLTGAHSSLKDLANSDWDDLEALESDWTAVSNYLSAAEWRFLSTVKPNERGAVRIRFTQLKDGTYQLEKIPVEVYSRKDERRRSKRSRAKRAS